MERLVTSLKLQLLCPCPAACHGLAAASEGQAPVSWPFDAGQSYPYHFFLYSAPPFGTHRQAIEFCAALSPGRNSILAAYGEEPGRAAIDALCEGCDCW